MKIIAHSKIRDTEIVTIEDRVSPITLVHLCLNKNINVTIQKIQNNEEIAMIDGEYPIIITANVLSIQALKDYNNTRHYAHFFRDLYAISKPKELKEYDAHIPQFTGINVPKDIASNIIFSAAFCGSLHNTTERTLELAKILFQSVSGRKEEHYFCHIVFATDKKNLFNIYNNNDNYNIYSSNNDAVGTVNDKSLVFVSMETLRKNSLSVLDFYKEEEPKPYKYKPFTRVDNRPKKVALLKHLGMKITKTNLEDICDICEGEGNSMFALDGKEYTVYTDEEADEMHEQYLEEYIDDVILPEIPAFYRFYFDDEAWKRDAKIDGRGHSLSGYDGCEHEEKVNNVWYFIYRTN